MSNVDEVLKSALGLGAKERASLAERLLASLDELTEEESDQLWAEEAARRLELYRTGQARVVDAEEVHRKAEKLIR
jgi:putative addiction module component (TIGR02574 family)